MYVGGCGTSSFICHGKREGRRSSSGRREISERKNKSGGTTSGCSYLLLKLDTQFVVVFILCVCPGLFELLIVTTTTWSVR